MDNVQNCNIYGNMDMEENFSSKHWRQHGAKRVVAY
jgi:hypothetical protein